MEPSTAGMIISTTRDVEAHDVRAYLGIVSGEATVRVIAPARSARGAARTENLVHAARNRAISAMQDEAVKLEASAVIGVEVSCTSVRCPGRGSLVIIVASGTAVTL